MYFDDDDEVEKLEEAMYEELQTNLQSVTLTIDINIVVKDLFKYWMGYTLLDTNYVDKWTN